MPQPPYRRPPAGEPPSSAQTARVMSDLERLSYIHSSGELSVVEGGMERQVQDYTPKRVYARISGAAGGTGADYPWTGVDESSSTLADLTATVYPLSGTATSIPFREINGNTSVPSGTKVRGDLSADGTCYLFSYTSATSTRQPRAGVIASVVGAASSIQPRTQTSGTWSNDGSATTTTGYPVQMDGGTFSAKSTANVVYWEESPGSGQYAMLPIQSADVVSGVAYPGFVSTGSQTWQGNKTIWGTLTLGQTSGAAGSLTCRPGDGSGKLATVGTTGISIVSSTGQAILLADGLGSMSETMGILEGGDTVAFRRGTSAGSSYPNIALQKLDGTLIYGQTATFSNGTSTLHFTNGILTSVTTP